MGILAALALADALRPKDDAQPAAGPATTSATTTRREPPTLLETLRDEAVSGFVLYSDQDCRLHSLLLPRMVDAVLRNEDGGDVFRSGGSDAGAGGQLLRWLCVACAAWSVGLLVYGVRTVLRFDWFRAAGASFFAVALVGLVLAIWSVLPVK